MKTLLIAAVFVGFSLGSTAQTSKSKSSKQKSTKTTVQKRRITASGVASAGGPMTWERLLACSARKSAAEKARQPQPTPKPSEPCFTYRKNNIIVTECPGVSGQPIELNSQSSYLGYYPQAGTIVSMNPVVAPQHNVINNSKGAAPTGGNFCGANCSSR